MNKKKALNLLILIIILLVLAIYTYADPTGTTITFNSTDAGADSTPANRSDQGGTITTMGLNAIQQNQQWKAYVGNISGSLTLDDSGGSTIYDWALSASSISGEVYVSRADSPVWTTTNCSNSTTVAAEEATLGISGAAIDSIQNTFNETTHPSFLLAGMNITQNSCNSTATYESDTRPAIASANFPLVLLHDTTNIIYATIINQDTTGYDGVNTFDFQLIVPDNPTASITTYYFFAEISS